MKLNNKRIFSLIVLIMLVINSTYCLKEQSNTNTSSLKKYRNRVSKITKSSSMLLDDYIDWEIVIWKVIKEIIGKEYTKTLKKYIGNLNSTRVQINSNEYTCVNLQDFKKVLLNETPTNVDATDLGSDQKLSTSSLSKLEKDCKKYTASQIEIRNKYIHLCRLYDLFDERYKKMDPEFMDYKVSDFTMEDYKYYVNKASDNKVLDMDTPLVQLGIAQTISLDAKAKSIWAEFIKSKNSPFSYLFNHKSTAYNLASKTLKTKRDMIYSAIQYYDKDPIFIKCYTDIMKGSKGKKNNKPDFEITQSKSCKNVKIREEKERLESNDLSASMQEIKRKSTKEFFLGSLNAFNYIYKCVTGNDGKSNGALGLKSYFKGWYNLNEGFFDNIQKTVEILLESLVTSFYNVYLKNLYNLFVGVFELYQFYQYLVLKQSCPSLTEDNSTNSVFIRKIASKMLGKAIGYLTKVLVHFVIPSSKKIKRKR